MVHFTSKNLGFVENITKNGLEARNTNVGAFVQRTTGTSILSNPEYFQKYPNDFIRDIQLFLQRYLHHGIRTNKDRLLEQKNKIKGEPIMMLINGDCKLEKGSDFEDHFILKEHVDSDKIIGIIDLTKNDSDYSRYNSNIDLTEATEKFVNLLIKYYDT